MLWVIMSMLKSTGKDTAADCDVEMADAPSQVGCSKHRVTKTDRATAAALAHVERLRHAKKAPTSMPSGASAPAPVRASFARNAPKKSWKVRAINSGAFSVLLFCRDLVKLAEKLHMSTDMS